MHVCNCPPGIRSSFFIAENFMKQIVLTLSLLIIGLFATVGVSYAAGTNCQPIYGGGQTCVTTGNILINKTVQNPHTNQFVDNLGINDAHFAPGQTVTFQITVTNTGAAAIANTTVKDIFPQFVSFVSGPGNFDGNTNTLTFTVSSLQANESRTFTLQGKVADANAMPADQGLLCVINQSSANSDSNGGNSQDNAQFCIQKSAPLPTQAVTTKGGLPVFPAPSVTTTPPTGPEALPLLAMIPTAVAGFVLRRKSKLGL